jgi:hypothetical protein
MGDVPIKSSAMSIPGKRESMDMEPRMMKDGSLDARASMDSTRSSLDQAVESKPRTWTPAMFKANRQKLWAQSFDLDPTTSWYSA